MLSVLNLPWQVSSTRVNEVDAWKTVLLGDFLSSNVFLHSDRVVRTSFNVWVVGNDDNRPSMDDSESCDNSSSWNVLVAVEIVPCKLGEF